MSEQLTVAGRFRAHPKSWVPIDSSSSQSIGCRITFEIEEQRLEDSEGNVSWTKIEGSYTVDGNYWVVGKDGKLNKNGVAQLRDVLGWDGDLDSFLLQPPSTSCQITVQEDEYKGNTRFVATWINDFEFEGGLGAMSSDKLNLAKSRYGGMLKAACSSAGGGNAAPAQQQQAPAQQGPAQTQQEGGGAPVQQSGAPQGQTAPQGDFPV